MGYESLTLEFQLLISTNSEFNTLQDYKEESTAIHYPGLYHHGASIHTDFLNQNAFQYTAASVLISK